MDGYVLAFIKAALVYLVLGVCLGVAMALPQSAGLTYYLLPSHAHLNLVGWVSMMIFGVAYHVIPRFSGRALYSPRLAWTHLAAGNAGVVGMVVFFFLSRWQPGAWRAALAASGVLQAVGVFLFVFNIWKTLPTFKMLFAAQALLQRPGPAPLPKH